MMDMRKRTFVDPRLARGRRAVRPQSEDVLAQFCERMVECGVPLWRVAVFVTTLHPDVMGRRFLWQAESGVTTSDALFDILETDDYRKSPFTTVYATREPLRRRLADNDCPIDFAVLRDLRAEGATDYAAFPLLFTDGTIHVATWSTQQPGGFTPNSLPTSNRSSCRWRGLRKFARCGARQEI